MTRPRLTLLLDRVIMLNRQSPSGAHTAPLKRIARGVLIALVGSLCLMPEAGSTNLQDISMTPKQYAYYSLNDIKQYKCLAFLYGKESAWNPNAQNGSHYGIPQGKSKYLSTLNGYHQIDWGLDYLFHRYGVYTNGYTNACKALQHFKIKGWH